MASCQDGEFQKLLRWARTRRCPGVLAICQPLIVTTSKAERNLRSFAQYERLLAALGAVSHDVVVLSGDVHFGRIARVPIGTHGARLIEIIASPLSNLTYLNGIATKVATTRPAGFPPAESATKLGWASQPVEYIKAVPARRGSLLSLYPRRRTREHFMTVGFSRQGEGGGVELTAEAWLVRKWTRNYLPTRAFARPFRTVLK